MVSTSVKYKLHYNFVLFLPFIIHIVLWLFVQAMLVCSA